MPADGEAIQARQELGGEFVLSLERGLRVVEALGAAGREVTLTEVAAEAGMPRAAARRFLLTLVVLGYVEQRRRSFRLTPKVLSLASAYRRSTPLWDHAEGFMRQVSDAVNESCSAAVLDGSEVVYVARVPACRIMAVTLTIGARLPAVCTSMGRVLLAALPPGELDRLLDEVPLERRTPHTLVDRDDLLAVLRTVSAQGFALVDQELEIGLCSVAVPIRDREGQVVAALNVSSQAARLPAEALRATVLPRLQEAARGIAAFFG